MKRALVLSGGGAKGSYQYGVWKALRELNINFDIVTGTSIGAVNGAIVVMGDFNSTVGVWLKTKTKDVFSIDEDLKTKEGKKNFYLNMMKSLFSDKGIDTSKMEEIFRKYIDEDKVRNSPIDYGIVTYSFTKKKPVLLKKKDIPKGKLIDYIVASATCFPVVKPKQIDKEMYLDGAYYDNLPIDLAIKMGADEVIAVDLDTFGMKHRYSKETKVKIIKPSSDLGSFLSFTEKDAKYRMAIGYNDTLKTYNKLDGNIYSFYKRQLDYNFLKLKDSYISNFNSFLINQNNSLKKIFNLSSLEKIKNKIASEKNIKKSFSDNIDKLGKIYNIDVTKIYLVSNFYNILFDKILEANNKEAKVILDILYNIIISNDNKKIKSLIFSNTKDFILSLYLVTVYQKLNFIKKHMFKNGLKRKVEYGNN